MGRMILYGGIDEAGYGPLFGPLTVARSLFAIEEPGVTVPNGPAMTQMDDWSAAPVDMWQRLERVVCRALSGRRHRIAVNDSKKLYTRAAGIRHLEMSTLAFAAMAGIRPATLDRWLEAVGQGAMPKLDDLPWYGECEDNPWTVLPAAGELGEVSIARSMLANEAKQVGVRLLDLGADVIFEDAFNAMVKATRSKAIVSFTSVTRHLRSIWDRYGVSRPRVVVDRQSGRMRYREPLALAFPDATLRILEESDRCSAYELREASPDEAQRARRMVLVFQIAAEANHMPVALASMTAKYTRELLMARLQAWFLKRCPDIAPTAGYGSDGKRFWEEIEPELGRLGIDPACLRRCK